MRLNDWEDFTGKNLHFISFSFSFPFSYDSSGTSKDEIKERFAQTMEFVEEYLRDVVCQRFPFSDKEKNKLTFEVTHEMTYVFYVFQCFLFMREIENILFGGDFFFIKMLQLYNEKGI